MDRKRGSHPCRLDLRVKEEFSIPLGTVNWGIDYVEGCTTELLYTGADTIDGGLVRFSVADDSAFTDSLASGFELRFNQDYGFERRWRGDRRDDGRQHEGCGDEGYIHREESNARGQVTGRELAGVRALHERDARVAAELFGDLAVAGIDGEHARGPVLEHAIGEASRRCTHVQTELAVEINAPVAQRGFEFEAAATYVAQVVTQETDGRSFRNGVAGLFDLLLVDQDAPGEDEGVGALAAGDESTLEEQFVETGFDHGCSNLHLYFCCAVRRIQGSEKDA